MFYWLCWVLVFIPLRLFWPTKFVGKKNLKMEKRAIMACNHSSNMDPVIINSRMIPNPYILGKHTLFKNKVVSAILRSWRIIPVNRENLDISTVKKVMTVLTGDNKLLIFPQGTRKQDLEDMDGVKNGLAMFAIKSKSPIVPMWFVDKPKAFHRNVLLIGEPFYLEGFEGKRLTQDVLNEASEIVTKKMFELRDEYEQKLQAKRQAKLDKKQAKIDKHNAKKQSKFK